MKTVTSSAAQSIAKVTAFLLVAAMTLSWTACTKSIADPVPGTSLSANNSNAKAMIMKEWAESTPTTISPADTSKMPITSQDRPATTVPTTSCSDLPRTTSITVSATVPDTAPLTTPATTPVTVPATAPKTTPATTPSILPATTPVTTPATPPVTTPVTTVPQSTPAPDQVRPVLLYDDCKAMWISQYDLNAIYAVDGMQREEADYTARIGRVLDNVKSQGFNTVFLQVRPNADSMAPSDYYPMSKYVVGSYGQDAAYDPVAIAVKAAHDRSLSIHAWINPLRCMKSSEIAQVNPRYKIRQWYDDPSLRGKYIVLYNGYYYLNPAYEEVRQLIVDGAAELLDEYAFDGLHMDDYFYPTTASSFDEAAYTAYQGSGGALSLADFRREQLNLLVSALYSATKAECEALLYGISPAGEIEKAYKREYADVYKWCAQEGYIDYICPQVYFGFEHATLDFISVCNTYRDIVRADSVKLIIGLTFGKAMNGYDNWAGSGKYEWRDHKDILKRSLEYAGALEHCTGISVFCYQYFFDPVTEAPIASTEEERESFIPLLKEISWYKGEDELTESDVYARSEITE